MKQFDTTIDPKSDQRRLNLNQKAVDSWGTAVVLDSRVKHYKLWIQSTAFVGFITPILLGTGALMFGVKWIELSSAIWLAGIVSGIQVVVSAILIFMGLAEKLQTSQDSSSTNKIYAVEANELAQNIALPKEIFATTQAELIGKIKSQETFDEKLNFTDKDRRKAARAGMKRFEFSCKQCGKIPPSASAKVDKSTCNNCGDF